MKIDGNIIINNKSFIKFDFSSFKTLIGFNASKGFNGNIITRENEENDIGGGLDKKLNSFKDELYSDLEKINLKILSELKNQADDIKILYQELNTTNMNVGKINKNKAKSQNIPEQIISSIDNSNIMSKIIKKSKFGPTQFCTRNTSQIK